jgi:hypothetical protein
VSISKLYRAAAAAQAEICIRPGWIPEVQKIGVQVADLA